MARIVTVYCCGTAFHRGESDEAVADTWRWTEDAGPDSRTTWIHDGPGSDMVIRKLEGVMKVAEGQAEVRKRGEMGRREGQRYDKAAGQYQQGHRTGTESEILQKTHGKWRERPAGGDNKGRAKSIINALRGDRYFVNTRHRTIRQRLSPERYRYLSGRPIESRPAEHSVRFDPASPAGTFAARTTRCGPHPDLAVEVAAEICEFRRFRIDSGCARRHNPQHIGALAIT